MSKIDLSLDLKELSEQEKDKLLTLTQERKRVIDLAEAQGIKMDDKAFTASLEQLKELEELAKLTKALWEDPKMVINPFKIMQSLPEDLSLSKVAAGGVVVKGVGDLFKQYVVIVAKKSYEDLKKVKKEGTPFQFLKKTLECTANMFFAFKAFRKSAQEAYPSLIALEAYLAIQFAPAYAALGTIAVVVSTVASVCDYKDKTHQIIEEAKKLEADVAKVKAAAKELEKEQGGVSPEALSKVAVSASHLRSALLLDQESTLSIGKKLLELKGEESKAGTQFIKCMIDITSSLPKSKEEVAEFIGKLMPDVDKSSHQPAIASFGAQLLAIEENCSPIKRIELTSIALQKLTNGLAKTGTQIPSSVEEMAGKIVALREVALQNSEGSKEGSKVTALASLAGCGRAFVEAVSRVITPSKQLAPSIRAI